ncbi:hypothetical protein ASG29_09255 [Sphingomonas sp. Leaf412]|uniref:hypothetical protein n=1 Tax=Sphingomonas sp. Leaf412 TaxID=1736370 RepID=UPI0006F905CD|nr:hypothetical protein [Sphingomonas sp. Leaf412]KQT32032.1 hypothetical protein ASG29_09255 [Sphingomonas sp. Leaf412]
MTAPDRVRATLSIAGADALTRAGVDLLRDPSWVPDLLGPWIAALRRDPWYDPPLRAARDPLRTGAVLMEGERAVLVASVLSAAAMAARPRATTLAVSGRVSVTRYHRAGGATLLAWEAGAAGDDFSAAAAPVATPLPPRALSDGDVLTLDGRTQAFLIEGAARDVVTLTVAPKGDGLTREYDRATGRLRRIATNDEAGSRTRMLLTLLRSCERTDAGACFDAATRDAAFHLRWAAMREWIALDAAAALPRLREMADDPHAEVRAAARATIPLVEAHPCPA